jgi:formate C-acetyltransferase
MNSRLTTLADRVRSRAYPRSNALTQDSLRAECAELKLSPMRASVHAFTRLCDAEQPRIDAEERIVFTRTAGPMRWGGISNICADWPMVLRQGLLGRRRVAQASLRTFADNPQSVASLTASIDCIDAILRLVGRYAEHAHAHGRADIAELLTRVPAHPATTFYEALQSLRFMHSMLWLAQHAHVGLGRFDQYMEPYLQADLDAGRITLAEAEELVTEFFITLNRDSDTYPGMQRGDNGQSMMLGGVKRDGTCAVNTLTYMALRVSNDVNMIDPKINLRITKDTDAELLCCAAELTRRGLGFPQYSNDDVVIPALVKHGYELQDARDYTVAACWEFIIPGVGMEIVNAATLSFPRVTDAAIRKGLAAGDDFDAILKRTRDEISTAVHNNIRDCQGIRLAPAPVYSIVMTDCLQTGRDLSLGARYNNYGMHGACSSNAADALAAVRHLVFDTRRIDAAELLNAMLSDYAGCEDLRQALLNDGPKVGNNDDRADTILVKLFDWFAEACESGEKNPRGGIMRPGTGSAMNYVFLARQEGMAVGATADGRHKGDLFSSSLAPSPGVSIRGPFSVLQTYSKIDYSRVCNGGPITMELSDTLFRDEESIRKVAELVRMFARVGCQQLQLNTLNVDTLRDAQKHPERHRNLIVRVWGWSGYFCELDADYQEHIIHRHIYAGV